MFGQVERKNQLKVCVKLLCSLRSFVINPLSDLEICCEGASENMGRTVIAVIVGYIVMFILQVAAFMTIYTIVGADWSFKPSSYLPSTRWLLMQFVVLLVTAIVSGLVCRLIARRGRAPLALAVLVLILGFGLGIVGIASRSSETSEVRSGAVSNMEAMNKARPAAWVVLLGPVIGAIGVIIGGSLKRS